VNQPAVQDCIANPSTASMSPRKPADATTPVLHWITHSLPGHWQGRQRFVILDLDEGAAARFEALHATWCADPRRCERLIVIALHGPESADAEHGQVQWMRLHGAPEPTLRGLQAQVDAFFLGLAPEVSPDLLRRLNRLAGREALLVTPQASPALRDGLTRHGFAVDDQAPSSLTRAHFSPRFTAPPPAAFRPPHQGPRQALVIGAGLAGCAAAWALSRQGWQATVLDRQPAPAQETSGNPGGLMHGTFNAPDSLHARWFRAASLLTARLAAPAVASGQVAGDLSGLLRLEERLDQAQAAAQLARVGLPDTYLRWATPDEARQGTGLATESGGWFYPQAGWLSPGDWSRWLLAQAASVGLARFQGGLGVEALHHDPDRGWQALDAAGRVMAEAPVVVLANALAVDRLLPAPASRLKLRAVRGQTTLLPADLPGLRRPRQALSGQGYGLTLPDGQVLIGATSQPGDPDTGLRASDQRHNLGRAARLGICSPDADLFEALALQGRVGWRATTPDRLPLIGPPPDLIAGDAMRQTGRTRLDGLHHRPRCHGATHGLYVFTGLGSRGLTSAALGGQVLAAWITGAPFPVEAALRDALDPARQA
jgi:tRNA 5-methylaminomethyl-2-thiouridine biosynthesis bifunctional protein